MRTCSLPYKARFGSAKFYRGWDYKCMAVWRSFAALISSWYYMILRDGLSLACVMTSCQGLYACISRLSVGSDWPMQATIEHFSHIFTSHHNSSHNYTTGRGIYTHTNTCSPARVQHAYNDTTQSYITQLTQWWTHHSCKSGSPLTQFTVCIVKHSGVPLSALGFSQINNLIWLSRTLVSVVGE